MQLTFARSSASDGVGIPTVVGFVLRQEQLVLRPCAQHTSVRSCGGEGLRCPCPLFTNFEQPPRRQTAPGFARFLPSFFRVEKHPAIFVGNERPALLFVPANAQLFSLVRPNGFRGGAAPPAVEQDIFSLGDGFVKGGKVGAFARQTPPFVQGRVEIIRVHLEVHAGAPIVCSPMPHIVIPRRPARRDESEKVISNIPSIPHVMFAAPSVVPTRPKFGPHQRLIRPSLPKLRNARLTDRETIECLQCTLRTPLAHDHGNIDSLCAAQLENPSEVSIAVLFVPVGNICVFVLQLHHDDRSAVRDERGLNLPEKVPQVFLHALEVGNIPGSQFDSRLIPQP